MIDPPLHGTPPAQRGGPRSRAGPPNARSAPRLRVVTLIDRLVQGGAERLAVEITTRLDPARFDRTLCVTRWTDPGHDAYAAAIAGWRGEIEQAGVRFLGLDRTGRDLLAWRPLMRRLRTTDVIHAHMFGSNVWAVVLGRTMRVPVVVTHEHTWAFTGERGRKQIDRHLIARGSDAFIACSREDRRRMMELEGIPDSDIRYVPNGITGRAPTPGRDLRAELGIPRAARVVGAVGTLREQKRFDVLIAASAILAERVPALRVLIAGEGEQRPVLEALIAELRLGDVVTLLGARTDVPDVLAAADVAVSSSDYEGSPLALMECMEAALPVVATRVGGVPDLIEPDVHGLLVARRDPAALAAALAELLEDPERCARMGASAQARRRAEFDLGVMVGRIEQIYEELYAARIGGAGRS
jgi:glycosyltransferase involved in cell wall biosynthesis